MSSSTVVTQSSLQRSLTLTTLILAGEAIFFLPFVLPRIFRPTYLETFAITNFQLGTAFSVYGIIAMVSYFLGGPLADKYSARKLMTTALVSTALGGVVLAVIPGYSMVVVLYGFWGLTSILLFWAALLRATREWGGASQQGQAYGFLDGGRGLIAAILASVSVAIFAALLPDNLAELDAQAKKSAFANIIWLFTALVLIVAFFVWWLIPDSKSLYQTQGKSRFEFALVQKVIEKPTIWLQATIVLCAYVGYKCTDDFSLYSYDAFGYSDIEAARVGTISYWVRPFAAILAGLAADRFRSSKIVIYGFLIMLVGSGIIGSGAIKSGAWAILALTIITISIGIYALRAIYFALFHDAQIPFAMTGTAVGVVSVVGYTPDIFMGPIMGFLTDNYPGAQGHQYLFLLLVVFALIGLVCSIAFRRITHRQVA